MTLCVLFFECNVFQGQNSVSVNLDLLCLWIKQTEIINPSVMVRCDQFKCSN